MSSSARLVRYSHQRGPLMGGCGVNSVHDCGKILKFSGIDSGTSRVLRFQEAASAIANQF